MTKSARLEIYEMKHFYYFLNKRMLHEVWKRKCVFGRFLFCMPTIYNTRDNRFNIAVNLRDKDGIIQQFAAKLGKYNFRYV